MKLPAPSGEAKLYRVTLDWNPDDSEEGDYCTTVWASSHDDAIRAVAVEMADSGEREFDAPADRDRFIKHVIGGSGLYAAEDYAEIIDAGLRELLAGCQDVLATVRDLIKNSGILRKPSMSVDKFDYDGSFVQDHCSECGQYQAECECDELQTTYRNR
ncbi:hypothetical protein DIE13_01765 [Burkholderia sp. Bp9016]|nr:hypothetical protein DIE13_01765 [Burkholderia sp. Bp9016]